jgi:hypothetical protein
MGKKIIILLIYQQFNKNKHYIILNTSSTHMRLKSVKQCVVK